MAQFSLLLHSATSTSVALSNSFFALENQGNPGRQGLQAGLWVRGRGGGAEEGHVRTGMADLLNCLKVPSMSPMWCLKTLQYDSKKTTQSLSAINISVPVALVKVR